MINSTFYEGNICMYDAVIIKINELKSIFIVEIALKDEVSYIVHGGL